MLLFIRGIAFSQSVEVYTGQKRLGIDLMWFKNFKTSNDKKTPFLFFSRNRASVDYQNSPSLFGSTNAISYNLKNGIGIVAVSSFLNTGITQKMGIQYYKQKDNFMFFGWVVADIKKNGNIDAFGLFRFQPKIINTWKLFSQLEVFPIYNPSNNYWNVTERLRFGPKIDRFAFGFMIDMNQLGASTLNTTENFGGFLRYDF